MNQLQSLAIVQFVAVPVLLAIALAVRFAGTAKPLNIVDYSKVVDPAALHRWAGHRLFLLPIVFAAAGVVSLRQPSFALPLLLASTAVVIVVCVWLAIGARRFQHGR